MLRTNSGRLAVRSAKRKSVKNLKHQIMGLQKRMDFRHAHALLLRQPSAASTNTSSGNGMMEVKPCESAALLQSLWEGPGRQLSVCLRSSARFCLRTIFLLEREILHNSCMCVTERTPSRRPTSWASQALYGTSPTALSVESPRAGLMPWRWERRL